jgi:hypothetical protein
MAPACLRSYPVCTFSTGASAETLNALDAMARDKRQMVTALIEEAVWLWV